MRFSRSTAAPATLKNLRPLLAFAAEAAREAGMDGERVPAMELAVEEILVNVINYAHQGEGEVRLTCTGSGRSFAVEIRDKGRAFDATAAPAPDLDNPMEHRPVGGLGIHFARLKTDGMRYQRENGENVLTLTYSLGEHA